MKNNLNTYDIYTVTICNVYIYIYILIVWSYMFRRAWMMASICHICSMHTGSLLACQHILQEHFWRTKLCSGNSKVGEWNDFCESHCRRKGTFEIGQGTSQSGVQRFAARYSPRQGSLRHKNERPQDLSLEYHEYSFTCLIPWKINRHIITY